MKQKDSYISNRKLFAICTLFVPVGIFLSIIHPILALLTGGFAVSVSLALFQSLSKYLFSKDFEPPSRVPGLPSPAWSDYLLFVPFVTLFVFILFFFGKVGDCLWGHDFWKGVFSICG
jgi:hypothetical protein